MRVFFLGDWVTKGAALVMAVLLWTYLYRQQNDQVELSVPLTVSYDKTEIARIVVRDGHNNPIDRVRIKVSGARADVRALSDLTLRCHVMISEQSFMDPASGRMTVQLGERNLNDLPLHAVVQYLPSAELIVDYWRFAEMTVPVRLGKVTDPPEGFEVKQTRIEPKEAKVRVSVDAPLPASLALPRLDLSDRHSSFQTTMRPEPEGMQLVTQEVTVYVEIVPKPVVREFRMKLRVLFPVKIDYNWSLNVEDAQFSLRGVPEDLDRIKDNNSLLFAVLRQTEIPTPDKMASGDYPLNLKEFGFTTTAEGLVGRPELVEVQEVRIVFKKR
jgi:YbbR domain-containing protein